jgi:hypothetical protein
LIVVATERTVDDLVVVKAKITEWKIKQEEQELFFRAEKELPNWRLADKARRMLADLDWHFSDQLPETVGLKIEEIEPVIARRSAIIGAGAIAVRAAGSVLVLLSAGYGPEAAGPLRRLLEAKLNAQAILDDETGQYAIRYLQGRPKGTTKLAQKYGNAEEIDLLSILTHADVRGLAVLHVDEPNRSSEVIEGTFSVMLFHRAPEAEYLLHAVAHECGLMCAALADVFGVGFEMPPWVSEQLIEMRDKIKEVRAQREAQKPKKKPSKEKGKSKTPSVSKRKAARRRRRPTGSTKH